MAYIDKDYVFSDTEFNLLRMYKETILMAFKRYKSFEQVCYATGVGRRTIDRYITMFGIRNEVKKLRKKV